VRSSTDSLLSLTRQLANQNMCSTCLPHSPLPLWSIGPPRSVCALPADRPIAATGCCAQPATCGLGCWTAIGCAYSGVTDHSRTIRNSAVSWRGRPVSESCRRSGPGRVLRRYSDAWHQAARRRNLQQPAGFPRRKHSLVPVRCYHGTFLINGRRVRLPIAKGAPELWVRLARPIPYSVEQVRAVTLVANGGRLWLAVTAAVPVRHHLDPGRVAGVDLGIIHPYALVTGQAGLLVSGRALRAESYLHLRDQQARRARVARRAPKPGQRGSRRWRRHRLSLRRAEARHRRRVHQAHHEAAKQAIAFAVRQQVGTLLVGDPKHITSHHVGRVQNLRLRQWRRTHLAQALRDKAERAGIIVRMVDERGTSSTCPACRQRVPKPRSRRFSCPHCQFQGHRDLVGAYNIAAKHGGGPTSTGLPVLVEHRRAGIVPARRDRRRHLHDRRRRSCLASGLSGEHACSPERRSHDARLHLGSSEDQATSPSRATVP
jgi:IS605 OrfB family transposase